jgi:hypothetical protein
MADMVNAAALFALLWDTLADVLGTAATATLLSRAVRRMEATGPNVSGLVIERAGLTYRYQVPESWHLAGSDKVGALTEEEYLRNLNALRNVVDELRPLLVELTGQVLVRRLDRLAVFREHGIVFTKESAQEGQRLRQPHEAGK